MYRIILCIGLLFLLGVIAWKGQKPLSERDDLPDFTVSLIEKGKHKRSSQSKQPPSAIEGSNVVIVFEGNEGDFRLITLGGDRELYVHKEVKP